MRWSIIGLACAAAFAGLAAPPSPARAQLPALFDRGSQSWLDGARGDAWASARTNEALERLYADARYVPFRNAAIAAIDAAAAPAGHIRFYDQMFALERTRARPAGLLQAASAASFFAGRPGWSPLLDLDALARAEGRALAFGGLQCAPVARACLVTLSAQDRAAAALSREIDLTTRGFAANGFRIGEGAHSVAWLADDTLLVVSQDAPGKPFTARALGRAGPGATLHEAGPDQELSVRMLRDVDGVRAALLEETTGDGLKRLLYRNGALIPLAIPHSTEVAGLHKGEVIVRLTRGWAPPGLDKVYPPDAVLSFPIARAAEALEIRVVFSPLEGRRLGDIAVTRDALVAAWTQGAVTGLLRIGFDGRSWLATDLGPPRADTALRALAFDPEESQALFVADPLTHRGALLTVTPRLGEVAQLAPGQAGDDRIATVTISDDGFSIPVVRQAGGERLPTLLLVRPPEYDAALIDLWVRRGGALAWVPEGADPASVAQTLARVGVADPARIGGIAAGARADRLIASAMRMPKVFAALVVKEPRLRETDIPRGALPRLLVLTNAADGHGDARRLAHAAARGRGAAWLVETPTGGTDFATGAEPVEQARRAALTHVFLAQTLIDAR